MQVIQIENCIAKNQSKASGPIEVVSYKGQKGATTQYLTSYLSYLPASLWLDQP